MRIEISQYSSWCSRYWQLH